MTPDPTNNSPASPYTGSGENFLLKAKPRTVVVAPHNMVLPIPGSIRTRTAVGDRQTNTGSSLEGQINLDNADRRRATCLPIIRAQKTYRYHNQRHGRHGSRLLPFIL